MEGMDWLFLAALFAWNVVKWIWHLLGNPHTASILALVVLLELSGTNKYIFRVMQAILRDNETTRDMLISNKEEMQDMLNEIADSVPSKRHSWLKE
jgi:hypothetical protein